MKNNIVLERVTLSLITHKHAPALWALLNEPDVAQYNDYNLPQSRDDIKLLIQNDLAAYYEGTGVRFAILHNQDNSFMGSVGLYDVSNNQAWLGFELAKRYWQQGYMNEVLQHLLTIKTVQVLFPQTVTSIMARVENENTRSIKLLSNLGFKQYQDSIWLYSINKLI